MLSDMGVDPGMKATCSGCGVALAQADVLYTADAKPVCAACNSKADLVDTDKRAAGNIVKAGWASLGAGALSFVGQIALLGVIAYFFVAASAISGAYNDRFTQHLTATQKTTAMVTAVVGIVLSVLTVSGVPMKLYFRFFF
jgi:hypothetical protein